MGGRVDSTSNSVPSTRTRTGEPKTGGAKTGVRVKQEADYIFHELTRSVCPKCKTVIDAQIIIRDNKTYMRKRCPTHGWS